MYSYTVRFFALSDKISFEVSSENSEYVKRFVDNLLRIFVQFDDNGQPILFSLQKMTSEIKEDLLTFFDEYKDSIHRINAVIAFLKKIQENEHFFFVPKIELEQEEKMYMHNYLLALSEGRELESIDNEMNQLFKEVFKNYAIRAVGNERYFIGEPDKNKRVCRFCKSKMPETTFKNKSHAISEGLGNKTLVLFEECDNCNTRFSKTIEPHIIEYLSLFRTVFEVRGKGGLKKIEGSNFKMEKRDSLQIQFESTDDRPTSETKDGYKLKLELKNPIVLQDIYKALVKFFISVIDSEIVSKFENTINWINGEHNVENLPRIAEMISYHSFSLQPKLVYYIRKKDDKKLPFAIGEFYFTNKVFVFIIPFSSEDECLFLEKAEYDVFWNIFGHFKNSKGWNFNDYSNQKAKKFVLNLNFKIRDSVKDIEDKEG